MDDFTQNILAGGGAWSETEVLGDRALVKVQATDSTLITIAGTTGFYRITNHWLLSDSLADLTAVQRNAIQTRILAMGYTQAEIDAMLGNTLALWRQKTFVTLLGLIATRRRKPRYDSASDTIVLDGEIQVCRTVESVDEAVRSLIARREQIEAGVE